MSTVLLPGAALAGDALRLACRDVTSGKTATVHVTNILTKLVMPGGRRHGSPSRAGSANARRVGDDPQHGELAAQLADPFSSPLAAAILAGMAGGFTSSAFIGRAVRWTDSTQYWTEPSSGVRRSCCLLATPGGQDPPAAGVCRPGARSEPRPPLSTISGTRLPGT